MSWFSSTSDQSKDTTFGYNLEKKNTVTEIREVGKKLEKTTTKYIGELDKYKEIQKKRQSLFTDLFHVTQIGQQNFGNLDRSIFLLVILEYCHHCTSHS